MFDLSTSTENEFHDPTGEEITPDQYFSEFDTPVQDFPAPQAPGEADEITFEEQKKTAEELKLIKSMNRNAGDIIVESANAIIAFMIASFVARNNEQKNYLLPGDQIAKIQQLVADMMPSNHTIMPKWAMLAVVIGTAYTPVIQQAISDRKLTEKQAEIDRLKHEIEKLNLQREAGITTQ